MDRKILYIIVPCFNEDAVLEETYKRLKCKLYSLIKNGKVSEKSKILFIDDGSNDNTWQMISAFHKVDRLASGVRLAANVGHQNAILAGLHQAVALCDVTITIDADLQQDIDAMDTLLEKYYAGNDIVYGVRRTRNTDNFFKKISAILFYRIMNMLGVEIIKNHADYRLMSKSAIKALLQYKEVNLFLRGIIPLIGFESDIVYFDVYDRFAGTSKYTLKKMMSLALNGITSFTVKPIRFITVVGCVIFCVSIFLLVFFVFAYFSGKTIQGWTSTVISVWAIGGLQLLSIGIIGEYIGRTYLESKERPKFIIWEFLDK